MNEMVIQRTLLSQNIDLFMYLILDFLGENNNIHNLPIPIYVIKKYAGENWVNSKMKQSISEIDYLLKNQEQGEIERDASNLNLLLDGKY